MRKSNLNSGVTGNLKTNNKILNHLNNVSKNFEKLQYKKSRKKVRLI